MRFSALLMMLSLGWIQAGLAASVEISLLKKASLSGSHYRLRDIASIESTDPRLVRKLGDIVIGRSPRPNYQTQISHTEVSMRIEAELPGMLKQVEWNGRASVRIQAMGSIYGGDQLLEQARQFLVERLSQQFDNFEIGPVSELRDLILPQGRIELRPRVNETLPYNKRYCVWLDIHVDNRFAQTLPVWFELSVYHPALIVLENFERGDALTRPGVQRRVVDITLAGGATLTSFEDTKGQRLRAPVTPGIILTLQMLELRPVVTKGHLVDVAVQIGGVSLNTEAVALTDGRMQQKIRVKNQDSGEDYAVVVTGPSQTRAY
ncbi:MAG: flagellar basal body P-ring formation protein FlgA [Gammaproteobacteria bacterium]|nr:flagellar basal body P-ring formation protein FlgA [Gammaproteobacteria bacterium]